MSEKIRKARKNYICDNCHRIIKKNKLYIFGKGKTAKYDKNYIQIGIEYYQYRLHEKNCIENNGDNHE